MKSRQSKHLNLAILTFADLKTIIRLSNNQIQIVTKTPKITAQ
jgi:hypothetical protein